MIDILSRFSRSFACHLRWRAWRIKTLDPLGARCTDVQLTILFVQNERRRLQKLQSLSLIKDSSRGLPLHVFLHFGTQINRWQQSLKRTLPSELCQKNQEMAQDLPKFECKAGYIFKGAIYRIFIRVRDIWCYGQGPFQCLGSTPKATCKCHGCSIARVAPSPYRPSRPNNPITP